MVVYRRSSEMRFWWIAATVAPGLAMLASGAAAYEVESLDTVQVDKRFTIQLVARLSLPIDEVFNRLTNYNELTLLSASIEESRQLPPDEAGEIIVYTRVRPCVLFVCKTVRIFEVITYPAENEIVAEVIPARSELAYGRSHWVLTQVGEGTLLHYRSEIEPGFDMFPLIGPAAAKYSLRKQAREFLTGLESER